MRRFLKPIMFAVGCFVAVVAFALVDQEMRAVDATLPADPVVGSGFGDIAYGRPDAPVTILGLVSLTCIHCARWEADELPAVLREIVEPGKARLVLRPYPLDMAAVEAATLVGCLDAPARAAAQTALMASQTSWAGEGPEAEAKAAGLTGAAAEAAAVCAADRGHQAAVLTDAQTALRSWKVSGTPTFLVGRRILTGEITAKAMAGLVAAAGERK